MPYQIDNNDTCPVCDAPCESECDDDLSTRWEDVRVYYCDACEAEHGEYPTHASDSLALDIAIERMMEDRH